MISKKIYSIFGENLFSLSVMRERLPKEIFKSVKKTITEGVSLNKNVADIVANVMRDWALEKGATHYTHWFQPLTGKTAEKHESFISSVKDGKILLDFSGKDLIQGEPDASSFPNGGLRATFEARGYTTWDCTSPAFIKEEGNTKVLYIPTAFCSYTTEALDEKTPLLRSMDILSKKGTELLRLFGYNDIKNVKATVGAEQEYFLIDRDMYNKRDDLKFTGRTLFGAEPLKGQEMGDHYFGSISEKVVNFMSELDIELWKLGVSSKTRHNEVAPAQHEIAPIFDIANIATDHNHIIMETLTKIAKRHNLKCLLHEKPFKGINGSGKHNNWSLTTDLGKNLLKQREDEKDNLLFLLIIASLIKGIDKYSGLLRLSASNFGNDLRLGGDEAPPAIISVYLGSELTNMLKNIKGDKDKDQNGKQNIDIGVKTILSFEKDGSDRNRTSPIAFTGDKFEFRMVPSSGSISLSNIVLNTIAADIFSEVIEKIEPGENFENSVKNIISDMCQNHKRVIFNGNGYSEEWKKEAKRRGIIEYPTMLDAISVLKNQDVIDLFKRNGVMSLDEINSRYEVLYQEYINRALIEAKTAVKIARGEILPTIIKYLHQLSQSHNELKAGGFPVMVQDELISTISNRLNSFHSVLRDLEKKIIYIDDENFEDIGEVCKDEILPLMDKLRDISDTIEQLIPKDLWPFPTYSDLLYKI